MFVCCIFKYGESFHDYNLNNFGFLDTFTKYILKIFDPFRPHLVLKFAKMQNFMLISDPTKKGRKNIKKSFKRTGEKVDKVHISVTFWINNIFCCIFSNFFNVSKSARNFAF